MPKRILTVGCQIPGGHGELVDFDSRTSLLDADFILLYPKFEPHPFDWIMSKRFRGKPRLRASDAIQARQSIDHWKRELMDALDAGKTVFAILGDPELVYFDTVSSEVHMQPNSSASSYDLFPIPITVTESVGDSMALMPDETLLRDYWREFGGQSQYRVFVDGSRYFRPLVTTLQGGRMVGAVSRFDSGGTFIAVPWMDLLRKDFLAESNEQLSWTSSAAQWGDRFTKMLTSIDSAIRSGKHATPAPEWALDDSFTTMREADLSRELLSVQGEIRELEKRREYLESKKGDEGWLKALLFEQGKPLEEAVLQAMRLMGFEANNYRDSTSEIDAVLECAEGRCIGEVEGRDNKPIDINKMRQLIVNIQEDFAREEVLKLAKGVLFGNAYRLTPPSERPAEHFTAKCMTSAQSSGIALVRTCDLFEVARELVDHPDESYAAACRQAILDASGQEVQFPTRQA